MERVVKDSDHQGPHNLSRLEVCKPAKAMPSGSCLCGNVKFSYEGEAQIKAGWLVQRHRPMDDSVGDGLLLTEAFFRHYVTAWIAARLLAQPIAPI